jgi:hypothetical protein
MKSLAELETQLVATNLYEVAIKRFRELKEIEYYKSHHSEAIAAGAEAAGISFYLFQSEMTRRNSLAAYYKRERKKAAIEASKKKAIIEAKKKDAFENRLKKAKIASRQMFLFEEKSNSREYGDY